MENEIWKPIVGYEGLYEVSNTGLVKSLGNGTTHKYVHILKPRKRVDDAKYLRVQLSKNEKKKVYNIHRLVAQAFIPNPKGLPIINHKDEDRTNNNVENLEWCDHHYNYFYTYNRHPELREKMASYLIDKENGGNISPWSKKGVPHTCKKKVARVSKNWEILEIYDSAAEAANKHNVRVCNLITGCNKNKERKKIHITGGNIFVFLED